MASTAGRQKRRKALHHHRPAVGPESRPFVVLPFAQPTAFTAGCGLVRSSVSSLGITGSVFWHRTTLEPHARSGSADTAAWYSPREPAFGTNATTACGGLKQQISASTTEDGISLAQVLDDPEPFKLPLFPARYTTSPGAVRGSWYLQVHVASAFSRGVQGNVDDSRGCLLYTSPSPRDQRGSRMPSSA